MRRSLPLLLLSVFLLTSHAAWSRTWYAPNDPAVTVTFPDGKGWNRLPSKPPNANGMLVTEMENADQTKVVAISTRGGVAEKELTPKDLQLFEDGAVQRGQTKVDSARFTLDGNRAYRLVTRDMVDGVEMIRARVIVVHDGAIYSAEALSADGNPFEDAELAPFLLSLHLPPGDGGRRAVPAPGFSVVLPAGEGWIIQDEHDAGRQNRSVKAADHTMSINALSAPDDKLTKLDDATIADLDSHLYTPGKGKKLAGRVITLPSGDRAYFTVGTMQFEKVVMVAGTYVIANGCLYGVQVFALDNPLLDPTLNRALFSLATQ